MDELKLTGNAHIGSRPILHFDAAFDATPQFSLLKELFTQIWTTPRFHAKSKPFIDHIMCFYLLDSKIWVRNYQIVWPSRDNTEREKKLIEIGPRFVLIPVRIFDSGFGGNTLFHNVDYESPNEKRRALKRGAPTLADRHAALHATETCWYAQRCLALANCTPSQPCDRYVFVQQTENCRNLNSGPSSVLTDSRNPSLARLTTRIHRELTQHSCLAQVRAPRTDCRDQLQTRNVTSSNGKQIQLNAMSPRLIARPPSGSPR